MRRIQLSGFAMARHCRLRPTAACSALLCCRALPGVASADVGLLSESADVRFQAGATSAEAAVAAVEACGFSARIVSSTTKTTLGGAAGACGAADDGGGDGVVRLEVLGMHCSACSSAVEAALQALPGVHTASVSLAVHQAEVRCGPGVDPADLVAAVVACGFTAAVLRPVESTQQLLRVNGMSCSSCSSAVEAALLATPGVQSASVNLLSCMAEVQYDPEATGPRHLLAAVTGAGFQAAAVSGQRLGECAADVGGLGGGTCCHLF